MVTTTDEALAARWQPRLLALEERIRDALRESMSRQDLERQSRVERDAEEGDTIFGIDVDAERILLAECEEWAREEPFVLVAEGVDPPSGRAFGRGSPTARVICDPIDGTRGLMFDKRSAWSLAAVAPERGASTRLSDVVLAAMTELPTTRQGTADVLWATRDGPAHGRRVQLADDTSHALEIRPSRATTIRHGFATVCNFFQGGKELTSRLDEELMEAVLGGWDHRKAEVYSDQYISSGGQLAELALGRDRMVLDVRPLVHRALGHADTLCSKPYDLCTALVARAAGCVVTCPDGAPLDPPLDTTTNVAFVGYANSTLADAIQPHLTRLLARHGLSG